METYLPNKSIDVQ